MKSDMKIFGTSGFDAVSNELKTAARKHIDPLDACTIGKEKYDEVLEYHPLIKEKGKNCQSKNVS